VRPSVRAGKKPSENLQDFFQKTFGEFARFSSKNTLRKPTIWVDFLQKFGSRKL